MKKFFIFLISLSTLAVAQEPLLDTLKEGVFLAYNPNEQTLVHQGKSFHLITHTSGHLSAAPVVSIGLVPFSREIISLDPDNAPYLEQKYAEILQHVLQNANTSEELFILTSNFVREKLFSPPLCSERALGEFLDAWIFSSARVYERDFTLTYDEKRLPVIPLEDFAKARCGVCRHQAFVLGYFLDKMQKDKRLEGIFPLGKTFLVRDEVTVYKNPIHHAWNLFISDDGRQGWHIDPTLGIIKDLRRDEAALIRIYGQKAIDREMALWEITEEKKGTE